MANSDHGDDTVGGIAANLSAGLHNITEYYAQGGGGAATTISYAGPGIALQTIPSSVLFTAESVTGGSTTALQGLLTNGSSTVTVASTGGLLPGMLVTGTGLANGDFIQSITNSTTLVLANPSNSANATLSGGSTLTFTLGGTISDLEQLGNNVTISGSNSAINLNGNNFVARKSAR